MENNTPTKKRNRYKKRQTTFFDSLEMEQFYLLRANLAGAKVPSYINACLKKLMQDESSNHITAD